MLYAIVEGMSRVLEVRREEIDGVLYPTINQLGNPIQSIVLVDTVAGGAGHVRRLEDQNVLVEVLSVARDIVMECDNCRLDESCYNCLQDYSNQPVHHIMRRRGALEYLNSILDR